MHNTHQCDHLHHFPIPTPIEEQLTISILWRRLPQPNRAITVNMSKRHTFFFVKSEVYYLGVKSGTDNPYSLFTQYNIKYQQPPTERKLNAGYVFSSF